ncbi:hypothetical protein [Zobellia sp. 1_MG-2023]|uniref:hypothetical protein n=1 Tax=Zobellia sp. 1_MG-2023 TaxID=3062626 RepID=UPI0026E13EF3|nr:hypothetical protein [Zobellia sp. 1_MG-2023]MDO6819489.1 hypothetical protein [Zobellia sp. 1_MG-2023]
MKQVLITLFSVLSFCSCKSANNQSKLIPEQSTVQNDSVTETPIKVFTVLFDSVQTDAVEQLTQLNERLNRAYKDAGDIKGEEYIERRLNNYKAKRFAGTLAQDFDNRDFTKATRLNVSFLTKNEENPNGNIKVEEWFFKDEDTANSCFQSLQNYREREIHFKFISWIWVQQNNKLFLVFSTDFVVDSNPMQTIKHHLIGMLKKQGEFNLIEMD